MMSATACAPCTATCMTRNRTAGHRRAAFLSTSRSAAESRPQISPTTPGRKGSGRFRSGAKSPSAASDRRSLSSRASRSPIPTVLISIAVSENEPLAVLKSGRAQMTTRAPSAGAGSLASKTVRLHTTRAETAATGSRRVRNTVLPRRFSSAIWPSTQIRPRRPTQSPTSRSTVRTGTGDSGVVSSGMAAGQASPLSSLAMRRSNIVSTAARPACPFSYSSSTRTWDWSRLRRRARKEATVRSS